MDIAQIMNRQSSVNNAIELVGRVVKSYPTTGGFWLNVTDKTGGIFVFSRNNYKQNELLKINGVVKLHKEGSIYIYGNRIIKVFQSREKLITPILPQRDRQEQIKEQLKLGKKRIIFGLVLLIVIDSFSFYFYIKWKKQDKKTEVQSFLESVNKDFTATLDSCLKTGNSEKRDRCFYRIAPYAVKNNLSLAIDICKRIEDNSELNRCINFLSLYMAKKDINSSLAICNNIENTFSRNNCILGLVPGLVKEDVNRSVEICSQFDDVLKYNCFYNIALSQMNLKENRLYCEKIVNLTIKDSCLGSFNKSLTMFNDSLNMSEI